MGNRDTRRLRLRCHARGRLVCRHRRGNRTRLVRPGTGHHRQRRTPEPAADPDQPAAQPPGTDEPFGRRQARR
uniref:hypothetical protein n=1 Tax=Pseudomonas capsici TaxID=2810614 RepID=UPI00384A9A56